MVNMETGNGEEEDSEENENKDKDSDGDRGTILQGNQISSTSTRSK
jgi:hypothetical protein